MEFYSSSKWLDNRIDMEASEKLLICFPEVKLKFHVVYLN